MPRLHVQNLNCGKAGGDTVCTIVSILSILWQYCNGIHISRAVKSDPFPLTHFECTIYHSKCVVKNLNTLLKTLLSVVLKFRVRNNIDNRSEILGLKEFMSFECSEIKVLSFRREAMYHKMKIFF